MKKLLLILFAGALVILWGAGEMGVVTTPSLATVVLFSSGVICLCVLGRRRVFKG